MVTLSILLDRVRRFGRVVVPFVVLCCMLAAGRPAAAVPSFFFQATSGTAMQAEAVADPGGSSFAPIVWPTGQGLPTALGGWPTPAAGFAPDVSFGNNLGISGYHTANLWLSEPALVQFEFVGKGDAVYQNQFLVSGTVVYDTTTASTNGPNPTAVYLFNAGLVPFSYIANVTNQGGTGIFLIPNGSNTSNPVNGAAFFLGFDPYTSGATFITSGTGAVYIGLSDRPEVVPDHDFQDLTVKVSIVGVPEPDALVLAVLGVGGAALAVHRRHVRRRPGFSLSYAPWAASQRSASRADMQPVPAAEIAWR